MSVNNLTWLKETRPDVVGVLGPERYHRESLKNSLISNLLLLSFSQDRRPVPTNLPETRGLRL